MDEYQTPAAGKLKTSKKKRPMRQSTMNFSLLSKVGSAKWRSNNISLAKENAKYKKEIQRLARIITEQEIRYKNLELSWLHRGEAISKVELEAAKVGTLFMKILESLKEIRCVCQKELNVPFMNNAAKDLNHLRKSMPNVNLDSLSTNSKGQLVNHVNPMVSGHRIITKPTIALQRLKMRRLQENREPPPVNPATPVEIDSEDSIDGTLGPITEVSIQRQELQENNGANNEGSTSVVQNEILVLPEAEVPLERLSLSRLSGSQRRSSGVIAGCIVQGDGTVVINNSGQNETQRSITYRASSGTPMENSSRMEKKRRSTVVSLPTNTQVGDVQIILGDSIRTPSSTRPDSPTPNQRNSVYSGKNSSVKKYAPSNRVRNSGPSTPKNGLNKYSEVFKPLIISLKDVGNLLQNGCLVGIDQLEEGKVKTGSSAEPKPQQIGARNQDNDITLMETTTNDQTHLNFTGGIGTLEYTRASFGEYKDESDSDEQHSALSPQENFQKRIAAEDPLEGPSWRYESCATPRGRRRMQEKSGRVLNERNSNCTEVVLSSKESLCSLDASEKQDTHLTQAKEIDHIDRVDMDITDISDMKHSCENGNKSTTVLGNVNIGLENSVHSQKGDRSNAESSSDEDWEPNQKKKNEQRKKIRKEPKRVNSKKSAVQRNSAQNVNANRGSKYSTKKWSSASRGNSPRNSSNGDASKASKDSKLTQAFVHLEILTPETNTSNSESGRARRRAAPTCFREPSLGKKLRRGDPMFK